MMLAQRSMISRRPACGRVPTSDLIRRTPLRAPFLSARGCADAPVPAADSTPPPPPPAAPEGQQRFPPDWPAVKAMNAKLSTMPKVEGTNWADVLPQGRDLKWTPNETIEVLPPPADPRDLMVPTDNLNSALDAFYKLNILELAQMARELEKKLKFDYVSQMMQGGVGGSAAAPAGGADGAPAAEAAAPEPPKEEKSLADLKLINFPDGAKFGVLREIRRLKPGMNLMDSKKLVENLPQVIYKGVPKAEWADWEAALKSVQAEFEFV